MISTVVLSVLLAQNVAGTCEVVCAGMETPALVVQVVDEGWLPLPGVKTRLVGRLSDPDLLETARTTDRNGFVAFDVPGDSLYSIRIDPESGFGGAHVDVRLGRRGQDARTAFVQIQLSLESLE